MTFNNDLVDYILFIAKNAFFSPIYNHLMKFYPLLFLQPAEVSCSASEAITIQSCMSNCNLVSTLYV